MANLIYDRRGFLQQAAAGAVGGAALLAREGQAASTSAPVIILGAGMAGLSAAWTLRQHNVRSIVLEGRSDRIGGRIWTSKTWSDEPVDLGASWMTHETINPLATLAEQWGIQTVPSELMNITLRTAEG